jgi:hypothetical protein
MGNDLIKSPKPNHWFEESVATVSEPLKLSNFVKTSPKLTKKRNLTWNENIIRLQNLRKNSKLSWDWLPLGDVLLQEWGNKVNRVKLGSDDYDMNFQNKYFFFFAKLAQFSSYIIRSFRSQTKDRSGE